MALAELTDAATAASAKEFMNQQDPTATSAYWIGLQYSSSSKNFIWGSGASVIKRFSSSLAL
jgi:hypothetical protein